MRNPASLVHRFSRDPADRPNVAGCGYIVVVRDDTYSGSLCFECWGVHGDTYDTIADDLYEVAIRLWVKDKYLSVDVEDIVRVDLEAESWRDETVSQDPEVRLELTVCTIEESADGRGRVRQWNLSNDDLGSVIAEIMGHAEAALEVIATVTS